MFFFLFNLFYIFLLFICILSMYYPPILSFFCSSVNFSFIVFSLSSFQSYSETMFLCLFTHTFFTSILQLSFSLFYLPKMLFLRKVRVNTIYHQCHHRTCQNKVKDNVRLVLETLASDFSSRVTFEVFLISRYDHKSVEVWIKNCPSSRLFANKD